MQPDLHQDTRILNTPQLAGVLALLLVSACGSDGPGTPAGPDGAATADAAVDPDGPIFLAFNTNVSELTEFETVRFSAVLTDPDGIDDLIGGTLTSSNGSITLGAFATSGQEGAYSIELSWEDLDQSEEIEFEGELGRTFTAEFYDVAGHVATRSLTLRLHCDDDGGFSCDGKCSTAQVPAHCGACNNACTDGLYCLNSSCGAAIGGGSNRISCDELCSGVGGTCISSCDGTAQTGGLLSRPGTRAASWRYAGFYRFPIDCAAIPPETDSGFFLTEVRCCCELP